MITTTFEATIIRPAGRGEIRRCFTLCGASEADNLSALLYRARHYGRVINIHSVED